MARAQLASGNSAAAITYYQKYVEAVSTDSMAFYELGSLFFQRGDYRSAIAPLDKASVLMPQHFDALKKLAISCMKTGDVSKAIAIFGKVRQIRRTDLQIIDLMAQCYRQLKNSKDLVVLLKEWTAIDKGNFSVRKELGGLLYNNGKLTEAAVALEIANDLKKCDLDVLSKLAAIYEKQNSEQRWGEKIQAAIQCAPGDPELQYQMARFLFSQRKEDEAETYLRKAIELKPSHSQARFMYGNYLMSRKRFDDAADQFGQALEAEPGNINFRIVLTENYSRMGKHQTALKTILPGLKNAPDNGQVLRWTGLLYIKAERPDSARKYLEKAVTIDRNFGDCFSALGDLAIERSDYKDAVKNLQKALDIRGFNEAIAIKMAHCYSQMGKADQARDIYQTVLSNNPDNGEALYSVAHTYINDKKPDLAKELIMNSRSRSGWYYVAEGEMYEAEGKMNLAQNSFYSAVKAMPDNSQALAGYGRACLARRNFNGAIVYLGKAMAGDPDNVEIYMNIGKAYEGIGEFGSALDLYNEVAKRQPDHPEVFYLIARINSKSKDHMKAIEAIKQGIAKNRRNPLLYLALGNEYRMTKQDNEALKAYKRAVWMDKVQCKEGFRHIGNIYYYTKKDVKNARKYYEKYVENGGQNTSVMKILRRMKRAAK